MQIIIFGTTRIGINLARKLLADNEEVVLVDTHAEEIADTNGLDIVSVNGLIVDLAVMEEAGINNCDCVCAVAENENMNLMVCQIAKKKFNVKKIIAGVFDSSSYRVYEDMGIVPISATDITVDTFYKEVFDGFTMEKGVEGTEYYRIFGREHKFRLENCDKSLYGKKIKDVEDTNGGFIFALVRDGDTIHNFANEKIKEGDRFIIAEIID